MVETECGFLNALGLPNPGYQQYREELVTAKKGRVPVIASIFGGNASEFVEVALGLCDLADGIELNLSCPHADRYGASIGIDPSLVRAITSAVKDAVNIPVWAKLTPNVTDITEIGLAAQEGGADAVVAINTVRAMAIDIESGFPILGNRFGGLSGTAIKPIAVKCVYDLYAALDIPIIGVGGISTWQDAIEMMMAGASAVQIGSAVCGGIQVFAEIADGIQDHCRAHGHDVPDICGIAHER
jgi:dihydroorotate dehydrogenase (NAD+) catalytic subunit